MDFFAAFCQSNQQAYKNLDGSIAGSFRNNAVHTVRLTDNQKGSFFSKVVVWDENANDFKDPVTGKYLRDEITAVIDVTVIS